MPAPFSLPVAGGDGSPLRGYVVALGPRRSAFYAAVDEFLGALIDERIGLPAVAPDRPRKAEEHLRRMFQETLRGLLYAGNPKLVDLFLLDHSAEVAARLRAPGQHLEEGDEFATANSTHPCAVARSYSSRLWHWAGQVARDLGSESAGSEFDIFPHLLTVLRDNILIWMHSSEPELPKLGGYVENVWGVDGSSFIDRVQETESEIEREMAATPERLRPGSRKLTRLSRRDLGLEVLWSIATAGGNSDERARFDASICEDIVFRLRQFRLLHEYRRRIIQVRKVGEEWIAGDRESPTCVHFASGIRPIDFFRVGATGPVVERFGLRYDITGFSSTMAGLEALGAEDRERALRKFFVFQRQVEGTARRRGLRVEKHLGDGVLFSSAGGAGDVLAAAMEIQRSYQHAVEHEMVFTGGIRIAANWGPYRIVGAMGTDADGAEGQLFGPGIVEISRLVSGKVSRDLEEVRKLLVGAGYRRRDVNRFFAPFERRHITLVDQSTKNRRFWAYVNPNGTLINEGVVITASFLARVLAGVGSQVQRYRDESLDFVIVDLGTADVPLRVGIAARGFAEFKGLSPIEVFEVVDADTWGPDVEFDAATLEDFSWLPPLHED